MRTGQVVLVLSALALCQLEAQTNLANIAGVITDPMLNAVPSALVRAQGAETGAVRTTTTGTGGEYAIPGLAPGRYTIEVEAAGFTLAHHEVLVEVGQNARVDLELVLGEANTSIVVGAEAETLKTQEASLGEV